MAESGIDDDLICCRKVFLFLFLCFFSSVYAHQISKNVSNVTEKKSVVIIGAGIAGLTAGRTLSNSGLWDVTLLEARKSRYGGRVWTDRGTFNRIKGVEADLGRVLFDLNDPQNEMVKMFDAFEVTAHSIESAFWIDGHSQKIYRGQNLNNITQIYQQILNEVVKIAEESQIDISLQMALNRFYKQNPNMKGKLSSKMFSAMTMAKLNLVPSDVSCRLLTTHKNLFFDTIIEEGFQEIVDRLLSGIGFNEKPLELEMNKIVRQIKVTSDPVSGQEKIQIRTTDRSQRWADAVIVAVPIGVLQSGDLIFEPPLPSDKMKAIQSLGIGTVNNLIFEFREVFWPKDIEIFHFVPSKKEEIGVMTTWLNTGLLSGRRDPYLTTFIQGSAAGLLENYTDHQLTELALERLQSVFQVTGLSSSDVISVAHSQWNSDSFSKGFFSYPKIGSPAEQWDIISQPICPYIFFAGEHTHPSRYGTVQGAYLSGLRAAEQVLNGCHKKPNQSKETNHQEEKVKKKKSFNHTKDEL